MTISKARYLTKALKERAISEHMRDLARKRAAKLTPEERRAIALKASRAAAKKRSLKGR